MCTIPVITDEARQHRAAMLAELVARINAAPFDGPYAIGGHIGPPDSAADFIPALMPPHL